MKKHTKQIVSGVVLFILGAMVIPGVFCIIALEYTFTKKPLARFTIPGQAMVSIVKPGRYYVWNDVHTTFEGKSYPAAGEFPEDLEITLLENQDGDLIEFIPDRSITTAMGDSLQNSIGYFEINEPESYTLSVTGTTEPLVCSFGTSIFDLKNVLIFLGTFAVTMLTGLAGFLLVVIGIVNLVKSKKKPLDAGSSPA